MITNHHWPSPAERGAQLADIPGGSTGLLIREYKGKRPVYRIDPGVISLLAELLHHERQAAKELGKWGQKVRRARHGALSDRER